MCEWIDGLVHIIPSVRAHFLRFAVKQQQFCARRSSDILYNIIGTHLIGYALLLSFFFLAVLQQFVQLIDIV
jgi:hypothetical protein